MNQYTFRMDHRTRMRSADPDELAIFGGQPLFPEPLHVGRPNFGQWSRLENYVHSIVDRRWFTNAGPLVRDFESRVADLIGVKHCVAVCNGTVALELAARAVGLRGEVIVPSFTFVATAHALRWQGIKPVFCDIDRSTHNLDPNQVEQLITPNTTGILAVHVWGRPSAIGPLSDIASRHGLALVFDSAHAFGCTHQGRFLGNFGNAEVFSFHATKIVHTGEGGAVVTNDDQLAAQLRLMKNFGFAGHDRVVALGINGKMCEMSAAMGLTNLEAMEEFVAANRENYHRYLDQLGDCPGITCVTYDENERCNYQYVVIEWDEDVIGISRDDAVAILVAENILARRYFYPGVHRMEPYRSDSTTAALGLPETDRIALRVIALPTGSTMTSQAVDSVCSVIRSIVHNARTLRGHLSAAGRFSEAQQAASQYPVNAA